MNTTYGYGDEPTWPACTGHPNDPRTEVDDDEDDDTLEARDECHFDRRMRERDDYDDWYASSKADQAAEEYFARRDRA